MVLAEIIADLRAVAERLSSSGVMNPKPLANATAPRRVYCKRRVARAPWAKALPGGRARRSSPDHVRSSRAHPADVVGIEPKSVHRSGGGAGGSPAPGRLLRAVSGRRTIITDHQSSQSIELIIGRQPAKSVWRGTDGVLRYLGGSRDLSHLSPVSMGADPIGTGAEVNADLAVPFDSSCRPMAIFQRLCGTRTVRLIERTEQPFLWAG